MTITHIISSCLLSAAMLGCAVDPVADESASAAPLTSSFVQQVNTARATFHTSAAQTVTANASAAGISVAAATLRTMTGRDDRTLATAATSRGLAMFLSQPVSRGASGAFAAGLYEIVPAPVGAKLYYFDPVAGRVDLHITSASGGPVFVSTAFSRWACENAPDIIKPFCETMASCWGWDLTCAPNDSVP